MCEWIKCSDRKPEDSTVVVAKLGSHIKIIDTFNKETETEIKTYIENFVSGNWFIGCRYDDGSGWELDTEYGTVWVSDDSVTHWLLLTIPEE